MSTLFERLQQATQKAKEKSKDPAKKAKPLTAKQKAKKFLSKLPDHLLGIAKHKPRLDFHEVCIMNLGHQCYRYEQMNEYQKLVFDGCKKLGLPVTIEETFSMPPGERESEGYSIYLRW